MLDQKSFGALWEAAKRLDCGFTGLPNLEGQPPGMDRLEEVLNTTAERLKDNYPYFHPLYAGQMLKPPHPEARMADRKSTRLNSSHGYISYAVFCLKKKKKYNSIYFQSRRTLSGTRHSF